jgi:hypothetical protein
LPRSRYSDLLSSSQSPQPDEKEKKEKKEDGRKEWRKGGSEEVCSILRVYQCLGVCSGGEVRFPPSLPPSLPPFNF